MKVLFVTNLPSPYRVEFFNTLGKFSDLTVLYERRSAADRNAAWRGQDATFFQEVYSGDKPVGVDKSIGLGLVREVKRYTFDFLIIGGYASPAVMLLIAWCRLTKTPYIIESDGGFPKKDRLSLRLVKRILLTGAQLHLTTCEQHRVYLCSLGIDNAHIVIYPFTSLISADVLPHVVPAEEKRAKRDELGIKEEHVLISVGQFIHRKGYDILLKAACEIDSDVGIYIIGGTPTQELEQFREDYALNNVYFIDFKPKAELKRWYYAADAFVLPTREDIWGLVINEAMASGLPVVTTERCIAGLELVRHGHNGYIVPVEDASALSRKINLLFSDSEHMQRMAANSLEMIRPYTIENMAQVHIDVLKGISSYREQGQ